MFRLDLFLRCLSGALLTLTVFAVSPSIGAAQDEEEEEETSGDAEEGETDSATAPPLTRSAVPPESWMAMGVALGLGAVTIAVGAVIGQLAVDQNAVALDPRSTQLVARSAHGTALDYALVSTVTLTAGSIILGIGALWAIVLPFSTPPGTSVRATVSASSIGLEGTF